MDARVARLAVESWVVDGPGGSVRSCHEFPLLVHELAREDETSASQQSCEREADWIRTWDRDYVSLSYAVVSAG